MKTAVSPLIQIRKDKEKSQHCNKVGNIRGKSLNAVWGPGTEKDMKEQFGKIRTRLGVSLISLYNTKENVLVLLLD